MNTSTAKVVRFHETGDASVLKIEDLPGQSLANMSYVLR